ncbi:hypothetical protein A2U01_0015009 [Trifolium medium]|uniref:Transposase (putative) gypsy type domain-containing protein n=1 Tax=Trifolium medium TaxID=97028 RepID=A0A392N6D8_9FABA|nr:hypothetical protein [Trifolium medium]
MAEEQPQPSSSNRREVDLSWVADEPRHTISLYAYCEDNIPEDLFTDIQTPLTDDWEFRMPFTDLEVSVFRHLHLAPLQLHPNSLAFLRAFEITADHLGLAPTLPLFFHAFGIQRSCPRGEKAKGKFPKGKEHPPAKFGWVSLKQRKRLFEMYEDSVRGFKEVYYGVRPITLKGWNNIVRRGHRVDEDGQVVLGSDGKPIEEDFARFTFYWSKEHYLMPPRRVCV